MEGFCNRSIKVLVVLFVVLLVNIPASTFAAPPQQSIIKSDVKPQELLIKLRPGVNKASEHGLERSMGGAKMRPFRQPSGLAKGRMKQWRHVILPDTIDAKAMIERLKRNPLVEFIEPNYIVSANILPNDPEMSLLWGLHNTGQDGGTADADIDAPEAWDIETGASASVLVAVIDTGVDYNHNDLKANMWVNPGEIPANGIDDDANGYIDDVYGYDFSNNDGDPFDDNSHGTHVAGTISARADNEVGITGVSWGAKIMAVKFLDASGSGTTTDAVEAILYATGMGAHISNNSWGGGGFSQALKDAIFTAHQANSLFVAAAGNSSSNNDLFPHYPSSYDVPNVLAVAATDNNDLLAGFSSYGVTTVDLGAPGVNVYSTTPNQSYDYYSGTSMATPHVSGAAAVALAQNPALTAEGVKALLMDTVDPTTELSGLTITGGRLNLNNAVRCENNSYVLSVLTPKPEFSVLPSLPVQISASARSCGTAITGATITASFDNNDTSVALFDDGAHNDGAANDGVYTGQWLPFTFGPVTITATSQHPNYPVQTTTISGEIINDVEYTYQTETFDWIDTSVGTAYNLTDDSGVSVPIGFSFEYQGQLHQDLTISSNGLLLFGSADGYSAYSNTGIPNSATPNNFIAPFWDDLNPGAGGQIYTLLEGVAPNRRFTVAWVDVPQYGITGTVTFEVTLHESSGEIVMQYLDTVFDNVTYDSGKSATVGVENANGTNGLQVSYNNATILSNTAYRVSPLMYDGNYRPVAIPNGPAYTARNSLTSFDGSASWDRDGDVLSNYRWDFGDGGVGTGETTEHTYTALGTYTVSLIVSDGVIDSSVGSTQVLVVGETQPVAVISDSGHETRYGGTLTFDGSASYDPDGDVLQTYTWDFGDGSSGSGASLTHTYGAPGNYVVSLVVNDGANDSVAATIPVVVHPNTAPVANPGGPYGGHWSDILLFDGSASSDADGDTLMSYRWSVDGNVIGYGSILSWSPWWEGFTRVGLEVFDGYLWSPISYATLNLTNTPPTIVSGGPYTAHWNSPVTLDASGSTDPDGDPIYWYSWLFPVDIYKNGAIVSHTFGYSGTASVRLRVGDGSAESTEMVQVTLTNTTPTADNGGPYTGVWGRSITFNGTGSIDPDGDSLDYNWDFGDGSVSNGWIASPIHTYSIPGVYTVTLTVTDGDMTSTTVSTTATIGNNAPVADAGGPYSIHWGKPLTLNASGSSDPDGHALSYGWDFGDGSTGTGVTPTHTYASPGSYTVTLTVADYYDSSTTTGIVTVTNTAPIANPGGPYTVTWNKNLYFSGSLSSDSDGDAIKSYQWDFGDGTTGSGSSPYHKYAAPGTYTVTLVVSDAFNTSAPVTTTVEVTNQAPNAALFGDPLTAYRGQERYFYGWDSSDPDGDSLTYHWDMGDGTTTTTSSDSITHTYSQVGTFTITLTVSDGFATSAPATATVTVLNSIPIAEAGPNQEITTRRQIVTLDGTASRDIDGTIVAYKWVQITGKAVRLNNGDTAVATFTAPNSSYERLMFELTITDNDGATDTDFVYITVMIP